MGSTQRHNTARALFLERLAKAWDKRPDLTFGELIAASVDDAAIGIMSDVEVATAIERFVLLGKGEP